MKHSAKKAVLSLTLALTMTLGLLPATALAQEPAEPSAPLTQSTTPESNQHTPALLSEDGGAMPLAAGNTITTAMIFAADTPTKACTTPVVDGGSGHAAGCTCWSWDPAGNEGGKPLLTLNGIHLETASGNALTLPANTTIELADGSENIVITTAPANGGMRSGITAGDALTIRGAGAGTGKLNVTSGSAPESTSAGINCGGVDDGVTIESGVVTATGGQAKNSVGIQSNLEIKGGTVTATGGQATGISTGISSGKFTLTGGTVTAAGTSILSGGQNSGISLAAGKLIVSGGKLIARSGSSTNARSFGIDLSESSSFEMSGGTIVAQSGAASGGGHAYSAAFRWHTTGTLNFNSAVGLDTMAKEEGAPDYTTPAFVSSQKDEVTGITQGGITLGDGEAGNTNYAKDVKITPKITSVTVTPATTSVTVGNTVTLIAAAAPENANSAVAWTSSDTAVATVSASGVVTGVKAGTATITATSRADATKSGTATVTVTGGSTGGDNPGGGGSGGSGDSGSASSSGSNAAATVTPPSAANPNGPVQVELKLTTKSDGKGGVVADISESAVKDAIAKAEAAAKTAGSTGGISLKFTVSGVPAGAGSSGVKLPEAAMKALEGKGVSSLNVDFGAGKGSMTLDSAALSAVQSSTSGDVTISSARVDTAKLPAAAAAAVGGRPALDFTISSKSGNVTDLKGGSAKLTIPYTVPQNEQTSKLRAMYIIMMGEKTGKAMWLAASRYQEQLRSVTLTTPHLSIYAVAYRASGDMTDVETHWAADDIEFVVSQGLLNGATATTFSPDRAMTRGMFVTALGRMAKADVSAYTTGTFSDVPADAYYQSYIQWAVEQGIASGYAGGTFRPDAVVSRQQMAVMLQNYAKAMGISLPSATAEVRFADEASISDYAKESVTAMQTSGILGGKANNRFDPHGNATRAQVAAVLTRFVSAAQ